MHGCLAAGAGDDTGQEGIRHGGFDVELTYPDIVDLVGVESALDPLGADETVTWRMYVPETYDPDVPAGLIVYISPEPSGKIRANWRPVIEAGNLIWIAANDSGNRTPTGKRILLASLAPYVASARYAIDPERVYLSGFSGGGKAAGIASLHLAELFKGAIFICGAELRPDVGPEQLASAATNRYVFLTGNRDFNRDLTRQVYRKFERLGLANVMLMIVPGMGHSRPDGAQFQEALRYLDTRE